METKKMSSEDYQDWSKFRSSNSQQINEQEINLIVETILAEMNATDPRMKLYIMDIKAVLEMMLRDDETRILTGRSPI